MLIIGITGTIGAGKGTIVDYLVQNKGFAHFSVREFIAKEVKKRGLTLNRDTLTLVANDLRKQNSPSFIVDSIYKEALASGNNCIIESIRAVGEVESLRKNKNFYLFAVDANSELRYERIKIRNSETDNVSYEVFLANEEREMVSDNPDKQNLKACIALADYRFTNDTDIENLQQQVEQVLSDIQKSN